MGVSIVFFKILTMFLYAGGGFALTKWKRASADHAPTLSAILVYLCAPGMILDSFIKLKANGDDILPSYWFFLLSFAVGGGFFTLSYFATKHVAKKTGFSALASAATFGNVGFFGLPIVTALFPDLPIVGCYSIMYTLSMNLLVFTVGLFTITGDKKYVSLRSALLNPSMISGALALLLYYLPVTLPDFLCEAFSLLSKLSAPLCMLVLGMRMATMNLREVFMQTGAFLSTVLKLAVFPLFAYGCALLLPFDTPFRVALFVMSATPTAAVVLSLSEMHYTGQKPAAAAIMISTLFCIATLPLLLLLV